MQPQSPYGQPMFTGTPQVEQQQPVVNQQQNPFQGQQPQQAQQPQMSGIADYGTHQIINTNANQSNGFAVGSLVFSLITVPLTLLSFLDIFFALAMMSLACVVILGIMGLTKSRRQHGGTIVAIIGLIIGSLQIVLILLGRME
ncbi:MAG: Uncharacterised protein [Methanobacteriota archaeon]|nr:MAG: Uncharacterised protein [Euryarchaeota archaeon]